MTQSGLSASKITICLTFALSAIGTFYYFLPIQNSSHFATPFSASIFVIFIYWLITLLIQFLFISKSFFNENVSLTNQSNLIAIVGPHFIFFNIIHFFWCYFFSNEKFIISEILTFINLLNLLTLYFSHKTMSIKSLSDWLTVHLPITGLPLSWTLYTVFWNGACLFHSHNKSLLPRILANIFIWEFLLVPMSLLLLYSDWSIALSTSFLLLGVGFYQMFTKLIALQWIFAFSISSIDFIFAILFMFNSAVNTNNTTNNNTLTGNDQAPLLT